MNKNILLFTIILSVLLFSSCRKKPITKEAIDIYEPLATKPNTTIEYEYQIFDSCRLSNTWYPGIPAGPGHRGVRYPYTKLEIIGFDTLKPGTCIIRDVLSIKSTKDSIFYNSKTEKFPNGVSGAPSVNIIFKGDSLFIKSSSGLKYSSGGYELRAIRK